MITRFHKLPQKILYDVITREITAIFYLLPYYSAPFLCNMMSYKCSSLVQGLVNIYGNTKPGNEWQLVPTFTVAPLILASQIMLSPVFGQLKVIHGPVEIPIRWTISFIMISDVKCRGYVNIRKIPRCDWLTSGHFRLVDLFIEYLKSCIPSAENSHSTNRQMIEI